MASAPVTPRRIASAELTSALAPTLGHDKSTELVAASIRKLGFGSTLEPGEADQVLDQIGAESGLSSVAARIARDRLGLGIPPSSTGVRARPEALTGERTYTQADLTELLAATLGEEKAHEVVVEAFRKGGHGQSSLSHAKALALLDDLAKAPGLVGVTARFAKARFLLRTGG